MPNAPIAASTSAVTLALVTLVAPVTTQGCHAYVEPEEPVGYVEVTSAPVEIESSPYVIYEGRPTYYYNDHWWYRGPRGHWGYYRHEPEPLMRQRAVVGRPVERRYAPPVVAHPEPREREPVIARPPP